MSLIPGKETCLWFRNKAGKWDYKVFDSPKLALEWGRLMLSPYYFDKAGFEQTSSPQQRIRILQGLALPTLEPFIIDEV